jgi:hypothetical protein
MIAQGPEPSVQKNNEHTLVEERSSATQGCILPPPPPPLIDNQGNMMWIVDSLVGHRHTGRRPCKMTREFHVHWLGYPPSSRTWEPRKHLVKDVPDMVHEYEQTHGLK